MDPEDDPTPPAPWERLPLEPDLAWSLFSRWITSEAPTVAAFAREAAPDLSPVSVASLASRWRWRARRAALEWHLARARVDGALEEARAQGRAHAQATGAALDWAVESIAARRAAGETLTPRDALAMLKAAIELQRLAAGEPTARTSIDLSGATDEGLAELRRTLEGVLAPKAPTPDPNVIAN